jgi:aminoglycoside 6'-N-acetyltransferase
VARPATKPILTGERLVLRPATEADLPALGAILTEPDVARWWGAYDPDGWREELLNGFVILVDDAVTGWIGYEEESEPDYRHAGLDVTLATRLHDQGYGREALRVLIRHLIHDRGHHRLTIDPAADNERAIRCYASVGFKPVGVMRAYERDINGEWRDNLLMDLLAGEFEAGEAGT